MIKIAEGTHSTVFVGKNNTVIKQYNTKSMAQREVKFLNSCHKSQYIIQPLEINLDKNQITLPRLISTSNLNLRKLPLRFQKNIIYSLINSLKELHNKTIIHHDFKIENILYDPHSFSIKIIDFSSSFYISEFLKLDEYHKNLIENNTSPYHKAPFKLTNKNSLINSDKYALIITVLQLYGFPLTNISENIKICIKQLKHKYSWVYKILVQFSMNLMVAIQI